MKAIIQASPIGDALLAAVTREDELLSAAARASLNPLKARLVRICTSISLACSSISGPLLAIKHVSPDAINDLSLEHFFNRIIEFVVILSVMLARLDWPIALTSAAFARSCTGTKQRSYIQRCRTAIVVTASCSKCIVITHSL